MSDGRRHNVRLGAAMSWARTSYRINFLAFLALSLIVTIMGFGQQVVVAPLTETLTLCFALSDPSGTAQTLNVEQVSQCLSNESSAITLSVFASLVFLIAAFLSTVGVIRGSLFVSRGRRIGFADTFLGPHFATFAITVFIIMIVFVAGLFLFVIPALIALVLFQFAPFVALDRGIAPFAALRVSVEIARRSWSTAILVLLVSGVAYIVSGLFWGIPTVVALPVAALVTAYVYRIQSGESVDELA